jgi:cytochrome c oxidase cbb3-type subunit 3
MKQNKPSLPEDPVRPHSFDGIEEYDKSLPNWWLVTFYAAIVFAALYWAYYAQSGLGQSDLARIDAEMTRIQAAKLSAANGAQDDETLWAMSRNTQFVSAGEKVFSSTCASCHGEKLAGGIGPSLVDQTWIHGGRATEIFHTVTEGVAAKGMPNWGPVLGSRKISEVVAFILSKHEPSEPGMALVKTMAAPAAQP